MFRKKRGFFGQIAKNWEDASKSANKWTRKIFNARVNRKKRFYRMITKGPKYLEIAINVLFIATVFFLFWKKSKDPDFLSNINR